MQAPLQAGGGRGRPGYRTGAMASPSRGLPRGVRGGHGAVRIEPVAAPRRVPQAPAASMRTPPVDIEGMRRPTICEQARLSSIAYVPYVNNSCREPSGANNPSGVAGARAPSAARSTGSHPSPAPGSPGPAQPGDRDRRFRTERDRAEPGQRAPPRRAPGRGRRARCAGRDRSKSRVSSLHSRTGSALDTVRRRHRSGDAFLGARASCPHEQSRAFGPLRARCPRSQERRSGHGLGNSSIRKPG